MSYRTPPTKPQEKTQYSGDMKHDHGSGTQRRPSFRSCVCGCVFCVMLFSVTLYCISFTILGHGNIIQEQASISDKPFPFLWQRWYLIKFLNMHFPHCLKRWNQILDVINEQFCKYLFHMSWINHDRNTQETKKVLKVFKVSCVFLAVGQKQTKPFPWAFNMQYGKKKFTALKFTSPTARHVKSEFAVHQTVFYIAV